MQGGPDNALLSQFIKIVGKRNALTSADDLTHFTHENRDIVIGRTPLVLKPGTREEVAAIVKLANETRTQIVPQGGHTGHAGGGVPDETGRQIVIAMERMNKIRDVDVAGNTMTVEAGVVLQTIQETAAAHDRLFPLALASQGSCQIGGNIATNAGGVGVLAYGNTRDLVLGIEAVMPTGDIMHNLKRLKKDNTGYDLRNLLIGSEGTLGIITATVLKLFPLPRGRVAAWVGLRTAEDCLALLNLALARADKALTAFEFMPHIGVDAVFDHFEQVTNPLGERYPWQVLMEVSSLRDEADAQGVMMDILSAAHDAEIVVDATVSASEAQRLAMWHIREIMPASQKHLGWSIKHDISVPVHRVPEFLKEAELIVSETCPGGRVFAFGHLGDGNIHYNVSQPAGMEEAAFKALQPRVEEAVFDLVMRYDGSISAEHGIGRLKRDLLHRTKDPVAMRMMRDIKKALDPNNIMNPGKVV